MKNLTFPLISLVLLTACGASSSATYKLDINVTDMAMRQELAAQSLRIMERRLEAMGEIINDHVITVEQETAEITIEADHKEALDELSTQLSQPFDFRVMAQAEEGETPELTVEGHGGFMSTGITGADLEWVQGREEADKGTGEVRLVFTEQGRTKMADLFERMNGKVIGIFVRNQLVSKLQVDTAELKDDIVIRDIPTAELAIVFADDVNVGIHVQFTPVP